MKKTVTCIMAFLVTLMFSFPALAAEGPATAVSKQIVETVAKGCQKELESYCKDVTPGKGRILACLYAHEDKLSGQCEFALYDASAQLEWALNAMTYVVKECREDLQANCSNVQAGEGRLLECLDKNEKKISARCKQSLKDVGLK
ncbi:MAG: cysteine rich repeat-containing protein [Desulfuromonadales bacterium]|jgi:hypothetical protein